VEKQMLSPATQVNGDLQKGLQLQYAKGTYYKTEELANIAAWQQKPIQEITEIRAQNLGGDYAAIASGLIRIPQDGVYFFRSNVAEVWIDGQKVVDNNALLVRHSLQGGRSMALAAGLHKIRIIFLAYIGDGYDTTWDNGKVLFRQGKDGQFQNITSDILFQKP
jgi:hexosaminidase